jgi:hypothetical protein
VSLGLRADRGSRVGGNEPEVARWSFGELAYGSQRKELQSEAGMKGAMSQFFRDVRFALRQLRRSPGLEEGAGFSDGDARRA